MTEAGRPRAQASPRPTPRTSAARSSAARSSTGSRPPGAGTSAAAALAPRPSVERRERPPSLSVVEVQRSRRLRLAGWSIVALVFVSMLGLAVFHSVLVQGQLHMDRLDSQIDVETQHQAELRLMVAQLGAPQRIIVAAGDQNMVPSVDRKYLAAVVPGSIVPPPSTTKPPKGAAR